MVVVHNRRTYWSRWVREPGDAPLGGHCVETTELDGRQPTINILPHLSRHANGILAGGQFSLEECRKKVRRYDTPRPRWSMQWRESTKSWKEQVRLKFGKDSVYFRCMTRRDENVILPIYPKVSRIYILHHSSLLQKPCSSVHPPLL